jgi:hypothetical protein
MKRGEDERGDGNIRRPLGYFPTLEQYQIIVLYQLQSCVFQTDWTKVRAIADREQFHPDVIFYRCELAH